MQRVLMSDPDINSIEKLTNKICKNLNHLRSIKCDKFFKEKLIEIFQSENEKRKIIQNAVRAGLKKRYFNKSFTFLPNNIYKPRCLFQ